MKTLYTILFLTLSCSTGFAMQPRYAWYNPVRYCTFLFKQDHQAHEQVRSNIYQVYRPLLTLIQVNNHNSFPKNVKSPTYNEDSAAGLRDYKKTKDELDSFVTTIIADQECMLSGSKNELEAKYSKTYTASYRALLDTTFKRWGMSRPEYFAEALAKTMGYDKPESWYESLQERAAIVSNKSATKTQEQLCTEFKEWQSARDKTRPDGQKSTDIKQWLDSPSERADEQIRTNTYTHIYVPLLTLIQVYTHNEFPIPINSPTYKEDLAAGMRDAQKTKDELDSFVRTVIRDQECMLGGPDNELEAEPSKAYTAYYRARVRNIYEEWGMSHPEYFAEALAATMGYSRPKSWYESLQKRAAIVSNKSVAKTQERLRTEFKEWQKARDKTRPAGQKSTDIQQWLDAAPVRMDAERSAAALTALALLFAPVDSSPSPLQPTTTLVLSTSPAPIREVQQVNDKEVEYKKMQAWVRTNFYDSLIALSQDKKKNAERLELALIVLEASRPFTGIYDTENQQEAEAIASVEGHFYGHLGRAKERCGNDQLRAVLEALQATVNENYVE